MDKIIVKKEQPFALSDCESYEQSYRRVPRTGLSALLMSVMIILPLFGAQDPVLRVLSSKGMPLTQTTAGTPFIVEVAMSSDAGTMQSPSIPGLESEAITSRSTQIQSINGVSQVSYRYEVILAQPGIYTLGPVEVVMGGQTKQTEKIAIEIIPEPVGKRAKPGSEAATGEEALLRVSLDKSQVVIGERITMTLQFLYNDDRILLRSMNPGDLPCVHIDEKQGPVESVVRVGNKSYKAATWKLSLSPTTTGNFNLPAVRADYTIPHNHDDERDTFALFASFFGPRLQQKRIYSNTLQLSINPLPNHTGSVDGIGSFSSYHATIQPLVVKEGEGMVLSLELEGGNELKDVPVPALEGLPEQLRYYDSKNSVQDKKRIFEYIVQGMQPGSFEVPAQTFTYYDVVHRKYKTLKTSPITVTILASSAPVATIKPNVQAAPGNNNADALALCLETGGTCKESAVPWRLFFLLVSLPLLLWLYGAVRVLFRRYRMRFSPHLQKKYAWINARKALAHAQRYQDYAHIYQLFMQACAERLGIESQKLSQDRIESALRSSGASEEQIVAWNSFFGRMAELVFFRSRMPEDIGATFFEECWHWLAFLEGRL